MAHDQINTSSEQKGSTAATDGLTGLEEIRVQAVVWLVAMLIGSGFLTYELAKIDRKLFDTKNPYLDDAKYRENRLSASEIQSERVDPRVSMSELEKVEERLKGE